MEPSDSIEARWEELKNRDLPEGKFLPPQNDEEWLYVFEDFYMDGFFTQQPDIEYALAEYRRVQKLHPAHILEELSHQKDCHLAYLMRKEEVDACFLWLSHMFYLQVNQIDGYRQAEYLRLRTWYYQHPEVFRDDPFVHSDWKKCKTRLSNAMDMNPRMNSYAIPCLQIIRDRKAKWESWKLITDPYQLYQE